MMAIRNKTKKQKTTGNRFYLTLDQSNDYAFLHIETLFEVFCDDAMAAAVADCAKRWGDVVLKSIPAASALSLSFLCFAP